MPEEKRFIADVDEKLHKSVRTFCIQEGVTIQDLIVTFFEMLLRGDLSAKRIFEQAKKK